MPCNSPGRRGALDICEMTLRPRPSDTLPGDHLVLIEPDRWIAHMKDEECLCETPHLEWCLTPLGAPVELSWSSANHHNCLGRHPAKRQPRVFCSFPQRGAD